MPDIDIDLPDRKQILDIINHIPASIQNKKHNTGVYFQNIPYDPINEVSSIDYRDAEERGYFKIDLLNVNIYKQIKNTDHLYKLMNQEPIWELLEQKEFVDLLFHVNGHSDLLKLMKPKSIEQLAAVLAMIRPAKKYLVGKDWSTILKEVWIKPNNDEYYFKKSHSISYAILVAVHMNLICESISYEYS